MLDREFGRSDNSSHALTVTLVFLPTELQFTRPLRRFEFYVRAFAQAQPNGLKDRRDGRADDVATARVKVGVPMSDDSGWTIRIVPVERHLEHRMVFAMEA